MTLRRRLELNAGKEFSIELGGVPALLRVYANGVEIKVSPVDYFFYKEKDGLLAQTGKPADIHVSTLVSNTLGGVSND